MRNISTNRLPFFAARAKLEHADQIKVWFGESRWVKGLESKTDVLETNGIDWLWTTRGHLRVWYYDDNAHEQHIVVRYADVVSFQVN